MARPGNHSESVPMLVSIRTSPHRARGGCSNLALPDILVRAPLTYISAKIAILGFQAVGLHGQDEL